jgi:hypothetical protein
LYISKQHEIDFIITSDLTKDAGVLITLSMKAKIKVIITGATGMVGEGVLHECLLDDRVEEILLINRRSAGIKHSKLKEIIHSDFFNFSSIQNQLPGHDACFFCLGVSVIGMKEPEYFRLTHTLTLALAEILCKLNPAMTFCYISGAGTDSSEAGRTMWARVKGKTENDLMKLPFAHVYAFRPGYIQPTVGLKRTKSFYKYISWLYPLLHSLFPKFVSTLAQIGQAIINVFYHPQTKKVLEVKDIVALSKL